MNAEEQPPTRRIDWLAQVAPVVAGLGLGMAYVEDRLFWLAPIALVPLGLVWARGGTDRARGTVPLAAAFLGGLVYHALALSWLRTCYADSAAQWFGPRTPAWLAISLVAAAFFAAMCVYGQYLVQVVRLPVAVALPIAWVSMEFAKQYAGLVFVQTEFPWTKLGMVQTSWLPLAQVADLGGEPLASLVVCVAGGAIADALAVFREPGVLHYRRFAAGALVGTALCGAAFFYGHWRLEQSTGQPGPVVCLMGELDLPPFLDPKRLVAHAGESPSLDFFAHAYQPPQLLLWSEKAWHHKLLDVPDAPAAGMPAGAPDDLALVAYTDLPTYDRFVNRSLLASAEAVDAVLVLGCERLQERDGRWQRFNSVVCVDPTTESVAYYDKRWLVPWGEYVPFTGDKLPGTDTRYEPGVRPPDFHVPCGPETYRFRASICYDLCFPAHFRPDADTDDTRQVDFFVHCGSEGQDPTGALARILLKTAQMRAIETRRAIVRNVNYGYSGIVDSNGVAHPTLDREPIGRPLPLPPLPIDTRQSFYATWGDGPLLVLCAATALLAWRRRRDGTRRLSNRGGS